MYNLIIIDDEILTLSMLKKYINWSELNLNLVGCFSSGYEALNYISKNTVHAVITDICIPDLDGLSIAEKCKQQNPDIAIGFISAHRNFEYAYTVSNMDSCGYVLKPIVKKELLSLCNNIVDYLKKNELSFDFSNKYNNLKFENFRIQLKCQEIFSDILCNNLTDENSINLALKKANIKVTVNHPCTIIEIKLLNMQEYLHNIWKHDTILLYNSINTLLSYNDEKINTISLAYFENIIYAVAFPKTVYIEEFENNLLQIVDTIYENLRCILKLTEINISTANRFEKISDLSNFTLFRHENKDSNDPTLIEKALVYINENYASIDSINVVADHIHLSPVYFGRYFAKKMNKTFKTYLNEIKIKKAKELLKDKNLKTTAISTMLGFKSESYFYTVFKNITGITPSQFRELY